MRTAPFESSNTCIITYPILVECQNRSPRRTTQRRGNPPLPLKVLGSLVAFEKKRRHQIPTMEVPRIAGSRRKKKFSPNWQNAKRRKPRSSFHLPTNRQGPDAKNRISHVKKTLLRESGLPRLFLILWTKTMSPALFMAETARNATQDTPSVANAKRQTTSLVSVLLTR